MKVIKLSKTEILFAILINLFFKTIETEINAGTCNLQHRISNRSQMETMIYSPGK